MCRSKSHLGSAERFAVTEYHPSEVPVQACATTPGKDWSTEITAPVSASPSLLSSCSKTEGVYTARPNAPSPSHGRRKKEASKPKTLEDDCNTSSACSPLCSPVPGLAWADPQAWNRSGGRSCLQPAPHGHLSRWCTVQREETPEANWL